MSEAYIIELEKKYLLTLENYNIAPKIGKVEYSYHNELEISLIKQGSGKYIVDGRIYDFEEGDIFIFNNIESHAIISVNPATNLQNMVIMFDPRFIWSIESNLFDSRYLKIFFNRNELFQNRLDPNNATTSIIKELLLEIEREFTKNQPEYELMIKVKLLNILVALMRHYDYICKDANEIVRNKHELKLINNVISFIDSNLCDELRLEQMAGITFMNPAYFSTFFKKYMGLSPTEFIAKKRINRAIEYLTNSNKTVLEIAGLCVYNNTTNFNKIFKKVVGKVPSDFR